MSNQVAKKGNALQIMADSLCMTSDQLKSTLTNTILKPVKVGNSVRPATDAEFMSFVVVANAYKLNPLTKEIYAFPDKQGGIVPIVSTDGWNRLMTSHPDYRNHSYIYSENMITMDGGKPCPEWCEIHIQKRDDSKVIVREYLDECYRPSGNFKGPWQTHTKRMLRHKTKIQGAREAFGFGGIYDEDEGSRIVEAKAGEFGDMPTTGVQPTAENEKGNGAPPPVNNVAGITGPQIKKINAMFGNLQIKEKDEQLGYVSAYLGVRPESISELTKTEAMTLIKQMEADVESTSNKEQVNTSELYNPEKCGPCQNLPICKRLKDPAQIDKCKGLYAGEEGA